VGRGRAEVSMRRSGFICFCWFGDSRVDPGLGTRFRPRDADVSRSVDA
jgi:hypothetical protein